MHFGTRVFCHHFLNFSSLYLVAVLFGKMISFMRTRLLLFTMPRMALTMRTLESLLV